MWRIIGHVLQTSRLERCTFGARNRITTSHSSWMFRRICKSMKMTSIYKTKTYLLSKCKSQVVLPLIIILEQFLSHLTSSPPEFWSKSFNFFTSILIEILQIFHKISDFWSKSFKFFTSWNSILEEFHNHLMYLLLKFHTSILIQILEEFYKDSAVSYSCIFYQNSDRNIEE